MWNLVEVQIDWKAHTHIQTVTTYKSEPAAKAALITRYVETTEDVKLVTGRVHEHDCDLHIGDKEIILQITEVKEQVVYIKGVRAEFDKEKNLNFIANVKGSMNGIHLWQIHPETEEGSWEETALMTANALGMVVKEN